MTRRVPIARTVVARLRAQEGFGLIELLIAMVLLNVGILALVASLQSGTVALRRAGKISTASVLADTQMELYRGLKYTAIAFDQTQWNSAKTDANYTADSAYQASGSQPTTVTCSPLAAQCMPIQSVSGPDHHNYRVDTYIYYDTVTSPASRQFIKVTVVVRDAADLSHSLARETSTFDQSTGQ